MSGRRTLPPVRACGSGPVRPVGSRGFPYILGQLGEQALRDVRVHLLPQRRRRQLRVRVAEAGRLDGGAVAREVVVREELGVDVRREDRVAKIEKELQINWSELSGLTNEIAQARMDLSNQLTNAVDLIKRTEENAYKTQAQLLSALLPAQAVISLRQKDNPKECAKLFFFMKQVQQQNTSKLCCFLRCPCQFSMKSCKAHAEIQRQR